MRCRSYGAARTLHLRSYKDFTPTELVFASKRPSPTDESAHIPKRSQELASRLGARSTSKPVTLINRLSPLARHFSLLKSLPVPVAFGLHDDNDWAGADSTAAASSGQLWVSKLGG